MKKIKSMWNFVKNKFYKNGITAIAKKDWWQIVLVVCFFVYSIYFYANNLLISDLSDDLYFRVQNFLIFSNILISGLYFCKKQTKKLIWGVQIQSFKTTIFSLTFTLFLTLFSTIFYNLFEHNEVLKCENLSLIVENLRNFDKCTKDYAEGATQIMIAIGTSLMAMAIFVFESIAKKRRYFDKYFLFGITNIFNLVILFFLGLFLLIFHYFETPYISQFIKNFIDIYIYSLVLIALAVIRIYKTAICLLNKKESDQSEDEIILNLYHNHEYELNKNKELKTDSEINSLFNFALNDIIGRLNLIEESNVFEYENTLRIILVFLKYYFKEKENKKDPYSFDFIKIINSIPSRFENKNYSDLIDIFFENHFEIKHDKLAIFLAVDYLNKIEIDIYNSELPKQIYAPTKIFKILIDKKIIINDPIQNYFYYFISLYEKGIEIKNSDKKLSKNEENFANILIDKSWRLPQELIKYHLVPNYKRDQQYQAISGEEGNKNSLFFKNYSKEFFIFYRELLKICFDNDDFESFEIINKSLRKLLKCDYNNIEKNDENYREIQQYKLLNLYGLASWILEKTNIDRAEKNQRFIDNICNNIFDIIDKEIDVLDNIANNLYETEFTKFIKLYIKAKKLDDNFDINKLLGLDRWDRASRGEGAWMSEVSSWINNFFIYFCLARFDKFQISKINDFSNELSKIVGSFAGDGLFIEIINNLDNLLKIYKPANDNNILKLLKKPIENIDNLINDLKSSIHKIKDAMNSKRIDEVVNSKIDKDKIAKFKDEIKQLYQKSFSIKNIFKQFGLQDLKAFNQHDNEFGINEALDKEYFIEKTKINLIGFDESCSNSIIAEENDNILNKAILQNPRLAEKLVLTNLNEFEKILESFGKDVILSEDVILILLNTGEHWFESELNKRTYYKNNFIAPRLRNTSESIPENAVGIYKFNQQKIPVYSIYSETKSGLLVLNKKKLGKLIQCKMNQNIKSTEAVESTFEEEFYLEILYEEDDKNKVFDKLRNNPPNWLKSKGDKESQENYLKQIVILKFLQSFELEIADNFEAYLIEMKPYF